MKISGSKGQAIGPMGPMGAPVQQEPLQPAAGPSQGDHVNLASSTQIRQFAAAAAALPSVRTGKVSELRDQIDDGSYHVDSDKLARKVVDETINDLLAGAGRKGR